MIDQSKQTRELIKSPMALSEFPQAAKEWTPPQPPAGNYSSNYGDAYENRLKYVWSTMRKRLWLIVGVVVLFTVLAAIYMARKPNVYQAQSRVQVDLENTNPALNTKSTPVVVNSSQNDPSYFNTQLQNLTNPDLLSRVAKTLDVEHNKILNLENNKTFLLPQASQTRSTWQNILRFTGLEKGDKAAQKAANNTLPDAPDATRDELAEAKRLAPYVEALQNNLEVEPVKENRLLVKETRLIDIRFKSNDPRVAAKVANTVAESFITSNLERKTETNSTTGGFLQKRITELQTQIRSGEQRLLEYARNRQILSLENNQNTVVERLVGLNKQLMEAENDRKLAEAEYQSALVPGAAAALSEDQGKDSAKQIAEAQAKLDDLRQRRAQLLVETTEQWPEVKEINQQVATLEQQVRDIRGRASQVVTTNLETKFRQTAAREKSLRDAFDKQRGETATQNEAAINYRITQQEIDTNKSLLDGLLQRSKENEVVWAGTPNNIHLVNHAVAADVPIGPNRLLGTGLVSFLSLICGLCLALCLEFLDDSVRSTDDVERFLHLPTVAMIPSVESSARRRLSPAGGALLKRGAGDELSTELLVNHDSRSLLAEAYRQLRTSILLSTPGHAPKTILVTSSLPGEGKTTTAVNTAISLAQNGASVLIVDADMRRPRLHSIFEMDNHRGLSTILSSEMCEAEALLVIDQPNVPGLHLLTSGPIPPNPSELLGSEQMSKLLAVLESNFTHIVIDSPPIGAVTDSVLMASMADGVLLVVHGGKTSRNIVRSSTQAIQNIGAKIFGVVLNNVKVSSQDYYYGSYYREPYALDETETIASAG